jgi:acyl carrier protein
VEASELRAFLRRSLPDYMIPAVFHSLAGLPLTPSGKVDRRALPAPERERSEAHAPPATPCELTLAELWQDLLGVDRVGREDDFFALGGHSLLATRLASRLRDRFRRDLSAQTVFHAPTLAAMARAVEEAAAAPQLPALTALPRRARRAI